jgi:hypothetical protein
MSSKEKTNNHPEGIADATDDRTLRGRDFFGGRYIAESWRSVILWR